MSARSKSKFKEQSTAQAPARQSQWERFVRVLLTTVDTLKEQLHDAQHQHDLGEEAAPESFVEQREKRSPTTDLVVTKRRASRRAC